MLPELVVSEVATTLRVLPFSLSPHQATWEELEVAFGGTPERKSMLYMARARIEAMLAAPVPIAAAWINGSFVTSKHRPSDVDVVVVINGPAVSNLWRDGSLRPTDVVTHVNQHAQERYEPGGTASQHLTDFHYVWWYPEGHGLYAASYGDLEHWSSEWSRVKVESYPHTGGVPDVKWYADCKGFVEVRW